MATTPDFSFKGQFDINAIANAMAQGQAVALKRKEMEREDNQKIVDEFSKLTAGLIQMHANSQARSAQQQLAEAMAGGSEMVPDNSQSPAPVKTSLTPIGKEEVFAVPTTEARNTPDYQAKLQSLASKVSPDKAAEYVLKDAFTKETASSNRGFQQSTIQRPDSKTGQMRTYSVSFDTKTGDYVNPVTKKPLVTEEDFNALPERGYAQGMRPAGYTVDGKEVVADQRTGNKYVVTFDDKGSPVQSKYDGVVYPKLDNVPSGFADSVYNLDYSQKVLGRMVDTFDKTFVGPGIAKIGKMSKYIDTFSEEQKVEFYGNVAEYKNSIIKAITGAQMSEVEAKRIIQQIPDENASPTAFMAGLRRSYQATKEMIDTKQKVLSAGGYITRGSIANPEFITKEIDKKLGLGKPPVKSDIKIPSTSEIDAELEKRKQKRN